MRLETRLLDYIDEMAPPVTTEEVVARRQSPNRSSAKTQTPRPGKGLAWALAAFVLVLTVGGLYFAFSGDDGQVVDQTTVPTPTTVPAPTTAGGMWPQSNLEEVREAQERADAGDPDYTWQLDEALAADGDPWGAEIFARFIAEELGWEDSSGFGGYAYGGGVYEEIVFIRCAPGSTNPLYPDHPDGCAPTIDELRYETVNLRVTQPGRRGPTGIWTVDRWEMLQPKSVDLVSLVNLVYPDFAGRQVAQVVPPSEAEVTGLLDAFLGARMDGEGAEQYLLREPEESPNPDIEVPLLYTTSGAAYERFEIEKVQGPVWPSGWMEYKIRLFAEDGTVVEQLFHVVRHDGQLGLIYGHTSTDLPTTENGQSVAAPFSLLDGEVTFAAASPWYPWDESPTAMTLWLSDGRNENVVIAADPLPGGRACESGPAAADAEALARSIMADPDFETTGTVPVRIAGLDGLQMDVVVATAGPTVCYWTNWALEISPEISPTGELGHAGWRMRLYLIDYPGESAQVLAITVISPENDFERVLEKATPIVESLEIHAP